jgi:hypothetical protein
VGKQGKKQKKTREQKQRRETENKEQATSSIARQATQTGTHTMRAGAHVLLERA